MGGTRSLGLGIMLALALASCGDDQEPAAAESERPVEPDTSAEPTTTGAADEPRWETVEAALAAPQGEYAVRTSGTTVEGVEVVMRDEVVRYDLDVPFLEATMHGAGEPLSFIYTDAASFVRSEQWEVACGTPWLDLTATHLSRSALERTAMLQVEPELVLSTMRGEPRLVSARDTVATYEVMLPGTAGLPPFPELPQVVAALSEGERPATVTVPVEGPIEIDLVIDLSEVDEHLPSTEPDSALTVHWSLAREFEPVDTTLPTGAVDPACSESAE